jgi:hypothetical protein
MTLRSSAIVLALVLVGCSTGDDTDDVSWGGGTAIGNPTRLAPQGGLPWDQARADGLDLTFERCDGDRRTTVYADVDLLADDLEWPLVDDLCRLEIALTGLKANGALLRETATLSLDIQGVPLSEPLLLELGDPIDPAGVEGRSGLYVERVADGVLDSLEREAGAVSAGDEREPDPGDVPILAVVGEPTLSTVLLPEDVAYPVAEGDDKLFDVVWLDDVIVGVGGEDGPLAQVSTDRGLTWQSGALLQDAGSVTAFDGQFFAAGFAGAIQSSDDGFTWSIVQETGLIAQGIAGSPAGLVAVGAGGVAFSPDGTAWTTIDLPGAPALWGIGWSPAGWVATGENGTRWFSDDGENWQETATGGTKLTSAVWTGNRWVATGENDVWTSPDGFAWTAQEPKLAYDTAMHDGALYSVQDRFVYRSDDEGESWTLWRALDEGQILNALASSRP